MGCCDRSHNSVENCPDSSIGVQYSPFQVDSIHAYLVDHLPECAFERFGIAKVYQGVDVFILF